ncbi:hypothetical protein BKA80DRAFT_275461 [Phyllosticta citrichinensis]
MTEKIKKQCARRYAQCARQRCCSADSRALISLRASKSSTRGTQHPSANPIAREENGNHSDRLDAFGTAQSAQSMATATAAAPTKATPEPTLKRWAPPVKAAGAVGGVVAAGAVRLFDAAPVAMGWPSVRIDTGVGVLTAMGWPSLRMGTGAG